MTTGRMLTDGTGQSAGADPLPFDHGEGCWHRIGVSGDRSCPELNTFVHCRNCPAFAAAARGFFDRRAPDGYLADWSTWLSGGGVACGTDADARCDDEEDALAQREGVSLLIFRLGSEWLAFRTRAIAEVTRPRPMHRVPHRSNAIFLGLVNLQGQAQLCVSLHGLLDIHAPASTHRLVVLRDRRRSESWAFAADEVLGVQRIPAIAVGPRPLDPRQPCGRLQPGGAVVGRPQRRTARRAARVRRAAGAGLVKPLVRRPTIRPTRPDGGHRP